MGWHNPRWSWSELNQAYTGKFPGDGNDSPAWTRSREPYRIPDWYRGAPGFDTAVEGDQTPRYAELHCHSHFSFLDGASSPDVLVRTAAGLGLDAIALTDHDGMYGAIRFAEAAREHGIRAVYGAELSLGLTKPQSGVPDPEGTHLLLLATGQTGYSELCKVITAGALHPDAEKGKPVYELESIAEALGEHCLVLTGCRKGAVRQALSTEGPAAAVRELRRLADLFGKDRVFTELTDHGMPGEDQRNDLLAELAGEIGCPTVATGAVHYAVPGHGKLAAAMAAVRARTSLDELDGWLPPAPMAYLRSGAEMQRRFARYPGAVQRAALLGVRCSFDLLPEQPRLPPFNPPGDLNETEYLRDLVWRGVEQRYGTREQAPRAYEQIKYELAVIEKLGFPGYFLIVNNIVSFCREKRILCQGRGSAANSAVCYALGITNVDAVERKLLFERFLTPERDGYPDIDLDIESGRREEVIQYVYDHYGRRYAAQVANVVTYRSRNAVRDMARALGYSPGQQDAWSKRVDRWGPIAETAAQDDFDIPADVLALAKQIEDAPRHLGIHSGGMVLSDRPVSEVCPVEKARMPNRSVLQWDKDDCATAQLVKFDLLGLGMLTALRFMIDMVDEHHGKQVDLTTPDLADEKIYEMLRRADSVGVFQVESRAQMATLPRLKPEKFYDLVIEVALIRPGPIQGGSVHPFIRRKNGDEKIDYDPPATRSALERTLGVPLFQEQLMQIAVELAGFDATEADELRRAMGSKRSSERIGKLKERLYAGLAENEITGESADRLYNKLLAFANFGFPESHALSFAHLVFSSAWFKFYYPAAFCAALLRSQPMGFYSPQSLVADARRHGVLVRGPDVNTSRVHADLEPEPHSAGGQAVRTGLATVRTIGERFAERIVTERGANGPYRDMSDLANRTRLRGEQLEALATAGATNCFGTDRRSALWAAGAAAQLSIDELPDTTVGVRAPELPEMEPIEQAVADIWATGLSPDSFPTEFLREGLAERGAIPANALAEQPPGAEVLLGGAVTHRQRPATAGGVTFMSVEDETGIANVICMPHVWHRFREVARANQGLLIRGTIERAEGVTNLIARHLEPMKLRGTVRSRDFH